MRPPGLGQKRNPLTRTGSNVRNNEQGMSGEGDAGRAARRLRRDAFCRGCRWEQFCDAGSHLRRRRYGQLRTGMRFLRVGYGAAAVVVAACDSADRKLFRVRGCEIVAFVCGADAAGMRRRSDLRQSYRSKDSGQREQEQQSGGQALHGVPLGQIEEQTPGKVSIEQGAARRQPGTEIFWGAKSIFPGLAESARPGAPNSFVEYWRSKSPLLAQKAREKWGTRV